MKKLRININMFRTETNRLAELQLWSKIYFDTRLTAVRSSIFSIMLQWKPLIVIMLVQSQFDHYKRLIAITKFLLFHFIFLCRILCKCHLYVFSMRKMEGNGQLQHLLNFIMVSNTFVSKAPFERHHASLITARRLCCAAGAFF